MKKEESILLLFYSWSCILQFKCSVLKSKNMWNYVAILWAVVALVDKRSCGYYENIAAT